MNAKYPVLKKQKYLELVQECNRSEKTKHQWCAEHEINYSTFMRWQKFLWDELAEKIMSEQTIVPVQLAPRLEAAVSP